MSTREAREPSHFIKNNNNNNNNNNNSNNNNKKHITMEHQSV